MATQDLRVWDGSAWVSLAGPEGAPGQDGASVTGASAAATNVPNINSTTLGAATATVTATPDANGDFDLFFDLGIPVGLPGTDGKSTSVTVGTVTETTVPYGQPAEVTISDGTPGDPDNLVLDFGFKIPQGEPGTGIVIKGSVATEADLPDCATYAGDVGDMYIVALNDAGNTGHGYVYNGAGSDCWDDVGQIKGQDGQDGCSPNVQVGTVTTNSLAAGQPASVAVQRDVGSPDCTPVFDYTFGIPAGADGESASIALQPAVPVTDLCGNAASGTASITQTNADPQNPVYRLDLGIPRVRVSSLPEGAGPAGPCQGDFWIVTT